MKKSNGVRCSLLLRILKVYRTGIHSGYIQYTYRGFHIPHRISLRRWLPSPKDVSRLIRPTAVWHRVVVYKCNIFGETAGTMRQTTLIINNPPFLHYPDKISLIHIGKKKSKLFVITFVLPKKKPSRFANEVGPGNIMLLVKRG